MLAKFRQPLINFNSDFFILRFLHSLVLERTESDLSKINWFCGIILLISIVLVPWGQVSIVSHSYQTYFGFPGSDLILGCGLRDHEVRIISSLGFWVSFEWTSLKST